MPGIDTEQKKIPVRDLETAPTILVNGIRGMLVSDTVATLNLVRTTFPAPKSKDEDATYDDVVLRLAMPLTAFVRIARYMNEQVNQLAKDGHIPIEGKEVGDGQDE